MPEPRSGVAQILDCPYDPYPNEQQQCIAGAVQSAFAVGGVAGGLIVSVWGGFKKKRLRGMLLGWGMSGLLGFVCFGLGRSLYAWIPLAALAAMGFPLSQSASNAIWQSKVAPDVQGRVFAARRFIAWLTDPIMPVVAGALADYVTEPAMLNTSSFLSGTFGWMTGTTQDQAWLCNM